MEGVHTSVSSNALCTRIRRYFLVRSLVFMQQKLTRLLQRAFYGSMNVVVSCITVDYKCGR